ncbi:MAG: Protease PrsW [candidate division WS2 bacterium]|nr:Protease PrsW [Candidatus Psychracetigena formicireducens]
MVDTGYLLPLVLGFFPAIAWLVFFLLEDRIHPEPKKMIFKIFLVGILSAIAAAAIQLILQDTVFKTFAIKDTDKISLLAVAFIEEFVKFAAVYVALRGSKHLNEPVDYMIYMITGALGFAAIENTLFLLEKNLDIIFEIIVLRAVGATLLHALASGFIGFYWAKRKLVLGILIATLLHAGFNYLILNFGLAPIYATSLLVLASFFLFYDFDIIKEDGRK